MAGTKWMRAVPYACAVSVLGFFACVLLWIAVTQPERIPWAAADLAVGIGGVILLRARQRAPFAVALITAVATLLSTTVIGPAFVAYVSLTAHRRWRRTAVAAMMLWFGVAAYSSKQGFTQQFILAISTVSLSLVALTVAGLYLRSRRDLELERAQRQVEAQRRQLEMLDQARLGERARIAREMHDVLAHRISILSLHAAALAHRTDLGPEQVRAAATVIQESAHQALTELRATVGGLRDAASTAAPQPSWPQLSELLAEVREAGQHVDLIDEVTRSGELPSQIGRHAYRIVQEALTNARKHAPGATVEVVLRGSPGESLRLRITNSIVPGRDSTVSRGLGLIGLSERVEMVSGTLTDRIENGQFVLDATLPWMVPK
ncbi:MAG: hypothetical protein H7226_08580 [Salinibacterium sp.]|nr:hypothetical protein [Salinibacterium sp.]